MLAQFGTDLTSLIITVLFFIVFIFFGPRMMAAQTMLKIEQEAVELEQLAKSSREYIARNVSKKRDSKLNHSIGSFMEFFAIGPVNADPYGVIKKIDHIVKNSDDRFTYFVNQIAPEFSDERKRNIKNALEGAMMTNQIAKVVRHYLELIKKYKMFQMAMVIQMQLPLIARVAKAASNATHSFIDGVPIGDGIGPLVAAQMMKKPKIYKEDEFAVAESTILGRKVWISKAEGPGASTGYPGKFLTKFIKENKISRIVTVDAALKLEGEKLGSVAEGVGVAMGGSGVDRYEIEEIAVKSGIPLDAIAVKLSEEDALSAMPKDVLAAAPKAADLVKKAVARSGKNDKILIIGVGNTCGIGNDSSTIEKAEKLVNDQIKKDEKKKEKKGFFKF
jgi:hypothetical protein